MLRPPAATGLVCELFVRGLGLVFVCAFASLGVQVLGLIGAHGIRPASAFLGAVQTNLGASAVWDLPSWFLWTGASDLALRSACWLGVVCALFAAMGFASRVALFAAWSLYLSLCGVADVFCSYQWDALLLEAAVVGWFVATPGSATGIWLARALCLKLMLLSGLAKLLSGDSTWRDLSALSFHWWTQPLPAWTAAWLSALPAVLQKVMTASALLIEVVVPLAILGPRRARLVAAALLALLQLAIAASGSYGFFNLLSLLLCAALLDDAALLALMPARVKRLLQYMQAKRESAQARSERRPFLRTRRYLLIACSCALLVGSGFTALQRFVPLPAAVAASLHALRPLRSLNSYGLFAVMTTQRREIAVEGSQDGVTWQRYGFRWKPDALAERPQFVAPHMPRLDWQMWFAALGRCQRQAWFLAFLTRLLEGAPDVLGLLAYNPFPQGPPRYLRTPSALYTFAREPWSNGPWWTREPTSDYCPAVTLREGALVRAHLLGP